jgi:hypothetical protein
MCFYTRMESIPQIVIRLKVLPAKSRAPVCPSSNKLPCKKLSGRIPCQAALMSGEVLICRTLLRETESTSRLPNQSLFGVKVRRCAKLYSRNTHMVSALTRRKAVSRGCVRRYTSRNSWLNATGRVVSILACTNPYAWVISLRRVCRSHVSQCPSCY